MRRRGAGRLPALLCLGLLYLLCLILPAAAQDDLKEIPRGVGFPIEIRTSGYFNQLEEVDDGEGAYTTSIDLRFRWHDLRLGYDREVLKRDRLVYTEEAAKAQLARIWHPPVQLLNQIGQPDSEENLLTVTPDGQIEWLWRIKGKFEAEFDVSRFPFDRQQLSVDLGLKEYQDDLLKFSFDQHDMDFAGHPDKMELPAWEPGLVEFKPGSMPRIDGTQSSQLSLVLELARRPGEYFWPIFVPVFAVMIVPVLAIWLNTFDDDGFRVDAFELVNMVIGGLFAVIALNFTINAEFPALAHVDNPITRLFGLNYLLVALGLMINIVVFKSETIHRWLGQDRLGQLFGFLCWGIPVLTLSAVVAIIGFAMA